MIKRIESGKRMSQAVVANGFVFLAGQVANDTTGSVENQTRQVLDEIDRLLALAGSGKEKILSANIYLANMADFAAMNSVWDVWVHPEAKPARATVEAQLAAPEYKVEIQIVALALTSPSQVWRAAAAVVALDLACSQWRELVAACKFAHQACQC